MQLKFDLQMDQFSEPWLCFINIGSLFILSAVMELIFHVK